LTISDGGDRPSCVPSPCLVYDLRDEVRRTNAGLAEVRDEVKSTNARLDRGFRELGTRVDNLLLGRHREDQELSDRVTRLEEHLGLSR